MNYKKIPENNNRTKGDIGEDLAVEYLIRKGYEIIERNHSNPFGEIDVIGRNSGNLCFIEVKSRADDEAGSPWEAVTRYKQSKIIRAALGYIMQNKVAGQQVRFDVVAVYPKTGQVELLKNAFEKSSAGRWVPPF
ncbi:MAG: YraN family protein [Candidatus Omnitrophica bacterium]|nr:YraN family protein [Candidatus Omnitrophota bacterium]